jgi:FkbM family methyltransferase
MNWITRFALRLYGLAAQLRLTETRLGRALFLRAYTLYKSRVEAREAPHLLAFIPQGTMVIDIGANVGFFTRLFAHHLRSGQVVAIEPEARNVADLKAMLIREGLAERVDIIQALVTDQIGERLLTIDPLHPANHHMGAEGIPTPSVTLDQIAESAPLPISLIKIDVQGAEMLVFQGGQKTISQHKPVLYVEVSPSDLERFDTSAEVLLDWIEARGYMFYQLTPDTPQKVTRKQILDATHERGYGDILCLPA